MKYLDERIVFDFAPSGTTPDAGVYRYELYVLGLFVTEVLVFTGNFYYGSNGNFSLDVTDIIRSLKTTVDKKYITTVNAGYNDIYDGYLHERYKVKVFFDENDPLDSGWETVIMAYRYPNYTSISQGDNIFFDMYTGDTYSYISTAIQGLRDIAPVGKYTLVPHYPLKETGVYKYVQNFVVNVNEQQFVLEYHRDPYYDEFVNFSTAQGGNGTLLIRDLCNMFPWGTDQDFDEGEGDVHVYEEETQREIAVFDQCYKRYYLFWQDRFGGYQSQAFNDYSTYSETFDTTETQNYKNERRKTFIQIQPKWKLNSGWISEEAYPMYESIFVSPLLLLYDTKEDRLHEVIVNSNYTEKTYKSEKKLLNLSLDLEAITKQNIIY